MPKIKRLITLFSFILLTHLYLILRYSGRWSEIDTSSMTKYAQVVQSQATIIPSGLVYPNGPGYPSILGVLSDTSGLSISMLQIYILPVVGILAAVFAFFAFKELTRNSKIALLAAFMLSLQPDFLLTSSRGTHEKFTYLMVLMSVFFLSRSFSIGRGVKEFAPYVLLFYLVLLGMISYNFFFASTYVVALTFAFIVGYAISASPQISGSFRRLIYTTATSSVFFFSYMFYIYPPARSLFYTFDTLADKIGALAMATEQHVTPQYTYIFETWISFKAWLFLTLFNWVIAPLSLAAWLFFVYRFFKKGERLPMPLLLLLMFYAAFSLQLLMTIFADRFGIFNNIELRIFPVLMFFAVPLASISILKIVRNNRFSENKRKALKTLFVILFLVFVVNALLKATNDPLVSNKWGFYTVQEKQAIEWIGASLKEQSIWAGLDERLRNVFKTYSDLETYNSITFKGPNSAYWLISDIVEIRAKRIRSPSADTYNKPVIYDSGAVKIYENEGGK